MKAFILYNSRFTIRALAALQLIFINRGIDAFVDDASAFRALPIQVQSPRPAFTSARARFILFLARCTAIPMPTAPTPAVIQPAGPIAARTAAPPAIPDPPAARDPPPNQAKKAFVSQIPVSAAPGPALKILQAIVSPASAVVPPATSAATPTPTRAFSPRVIFPSVFLSFLRITKSFIGYRAFRPFFLRR